LTRERQVVSRRGATDAGASRIGMVAVGEVGRAGVRRVERVLGGGPSLVGKELANVFVTKTRLVERFAHESKFVTQALDGRHGGRDGGGCARLRASEVVEIDLVHSIFAVSEDDAIVEGFHNVTRLTRAMPAPLVGRWNFDTAVDEVF